MIDITPDIVTKRTMYDRMKWMAKWLKARNYDLTEDTLKEYLFITYNAARSVWSFRYAARKVYCLNQKTAAPLGNDAIHNLIQKAEQRQEPLHYRTKTIINTLHITPEEVAALGIGHNLQEATERRERKYQREARKRKVKALFRQGKTTKEIAALMPELTESTINRIVKTLREQQQEDFTTRIKQLKDSGVSVTEIARLCSVSRTTIYKALSVHENAFFQETVIEKDFEIQSVQGTPDNENPDKICRQGDSTEGVNLRTLDGGKQEDFITTTIERTINAPTEHDLALNLLQNTRQNICLLGYAGTGKSTILTEYLGSLTKQQRKQVLITAPTNLAALRINGQTIHKAFALKAELQPTGRIKTIPKSLLKYDTLIIDEIGIVSIDVFSRIMQILNYIKRKHKKSIRIIVCGDFSQIEPVGTKDKEQLYSLYPEARKGIFAFNSSAWENCHFKKIILSKVHRQEDSSLVNHLEQIRLGDKSAVDWFNRNASRTVDFDAIAICPTNKLVEEYNGYQLAFMPGLININAEITGNINTSDLPCPLQLTIAAGVRVMATVNTKHYKNGELGTVTQIGNDYINIKLDSSGKEVSVKKKTFTLEDGIIRQYPLQLAYAITAHKAQGLQFRSVIIVPGFWAVGQLYVALSRVSELRHICIDGNLKSSECVVNETALAMMQPD